MAEQLKATALVWIHRGGCLLLLLYGLYSLWSIDVMAAKEGGRSISLAVDGWQLLGAGEAVAAGTLGLAGLRARWVWGATAALWLADVIARVAG